MIGDRFLKEIDETLDQLICNAETIENVDLNDLSEVEIDAFQKTQESLLQHFIHMNELFSRKDLKTPDKRSATTKIQAKWLQFEKLKSSHQQNLNRAKRLSSKRKSKRFLNVR